MAVSAADLNQIRVSTLGTSVDQATTWTAAPPGAANTLAGTERVITRALNNLSTGLANALGGTNGFAGRFDAVVGNEAGPDQAAFDAIGMTLIQAVAALVAGGGVAPGALTFAFEFPDPLNIGDQVEVAVTQDVTIPADLEGAQYVGAPQPDEIQFLLTVEPAGDEIGHLLVDGSSVSMTGIGGEVTAGSVLRMSALDVIGAPVSPGVVISVRAERATAPVTAGRFEHDQNVAEPTWTITHNLGQRLVAVQIEDDAGNGVLTADIDYQTTSRCVVNFAKPKAGTAVVRR